MVRTPVAKNVYCYMDIKIGPRFAGRMVFEVSRKVERAFIVYNMCFKPVYVTIHTTLSL